MLSTLINYKPRNLKYIEDSKGVLHNAEKLYNERKMIIDVFKNEVFPFYSRR